MELEFVQLLQDMIGDLEGAAEPIEVKIFGDDPRRSPPSPSGSRTRSEGVEGRGGRRGAAARAPPRPPGGSTRRPPAAPGSPSSRCRTSSPPPGSARRRPSCDWATAASPCACATRTPTASIPTRSGADSPCGPRTAGWCRCPAWPRPVVATGEPSSRARTCARWPWSPAAWKGATWAARSTEIQGTLRRRQAAGRATPSEVGGQYESQRQAFRELLLVFGTAAALVLLVLVIEFRAFTPALILLLAAPLSLRRRLPAAAARPARSSTSPRPWG